SPGARVKNQSHTAFFHSEILEEVRMANLVESGTVPYWWPGSQSENGHFKLDHCRGRRSLDSRHCGPKKENPPVREGKKTFWSFFGSPFYWLARIAIVVAIPAANQPSLAKSCLWM